MNTVATRNARWTPINVASAVLGFAVWWPLGIAAIAYVLWGGSIDDAAQERFLTAQGCHIPATLVGQCGVRCLS